MTEQGPSSRRQFLKTLTWLAAAGVSGPLSDLFRYADAAPAEKGKKSYELAPWTGDDFTLGHKLRSGELPVMPAESERTVDFVIVGGGIAGLTSAYFLKDHNYLLLEQYDELGGQSRGRSYRGIEYSLGAAYLGSKDGIHGRLIDELGITPVELPPTKNSWYWEGKWYPGISGKDQSLFYKELERLIADCKPIWKLMPDGEPRLPLTDGELVKLDSTTFASLLEGHDPKFVSMINNFLKSSCCAGADQLSAIAGTYLLADLISPSYVFKGGNPAIAKALRQKLDKAGSGRSITGAFVWRVDLRENGASVVYTTRDGAAHRVNCKHAIVTAPPLVAARIIPDLDDRTKASLLWFKFGSYLVANFCMRKKVFNGAYDNWVGSPFTFSDVIIAETPYLATHTYKPEMGSVLTVYQPYSNQSQGRPLLLQGDREAFASSLIAQISKLVAQFQGNLDELVLTRWGHAMAIARPGMFAKLAQIQAGDTGPVSLAHNSMAGLPSAESAITAARFAADRALKVKPRI